MAMTHGAAPEPPISGSAIVASEVRAAIARRGWSTREFARQAGVDHMWCSRRFGYTPKTGMSFEDVALVASVLGIDPAQLIEPWLRACRDSNPKPSDLVPAPVLQLVRPSPVTPLRRTQPVAPDTRPARRHLSAVDGIAS